MEKKSTIKDVARYAGVSVATVSYVINNINKVSEETKERVKKAMDELDYQPDFSARTLSMKKSNIIGIVLPSIESGTVESSIMHDNPFYPEFLSGVEYFSRKCGYDIMVTGIKSVEYQSWISKRNIDGLVLLGLYSQEIVTQIKGKGKSNMPVVITDWYGEETEMFINLGVADEEGGYIAVNHLINKGHKNIAIAAGEPEISSVNNARLNGYKKALSENNIPVSEELIFKSGVSFEDGEKIGRKIAQNNCATAVFAVADIMAMGIIRGVTAEGKSIPKDVAVVGFDDLNIAKYVTPALTTVRQDIFKRGELAAKLIIDKIEGNEGECRNVIMPVEIIEREST